MVRFIDVVNFADKFLDCVPIVSTGKNAGILCYQRVCKVDRTANPVNPSWKDDIKIHVLSKDDFVSKCSMVPIIGNVAAFIYHIVDATKKSSLIRSQGYLTEAIWTSNRGLKKHSYEVIKLYLARNSNLPEHKLCTALENSISAGREDVFKLILNSRNTWSSAGLEKVLKSVKLTDHQAGSIVNFLAKSNSNQHDIIELFLKNYPNIDADEVAEGLKYVAGKRDCSNVVALFLSRCPQLEEKHKAAALEIASQRGLKKHIELFFHNSPQLVTTHLSEALKQATCHGRIKILKSLLLTYKQNVTTSDVVGVLAGLIVASGYGNTKCLVFIEDLLDRYPNLSGKDLEPFMDTAALYNLDLFEKYLNRLPQLQPENLQKILNHLTSFGDDALTTVQHIQQKFPDMRAESQS